MGRKEMRMNTKESGKSKTYKENTGKRTGHQANRERGSEDIYEGNRCVKQRKRM
jgi:hypothetical protein